MGGESTRRGVPLSEGGFGGSPPRKYLLIGCLYVHFNAFWMSFGPEFLLSWAVSEQATLAYL